MPLLSLSFAALTAGTALLTRLAPRQYRYLVLLGASLLFYSFCGLKAFCGMLGNMLCCFFLAWGIERCQSGGKRTQAKALMTAAVFAECGLAACFHGQWLGSSFFALILLSYVFDVYHGKERAQKNIFRFASFAFFFPQMTQGPICRYRITGKQLEDGKAAKWEEVCAGFERILWGLLKKLVLADRLAVFVGAVYSAPGEFSGGALWLAVFCYAVEIYADFSGCMDIVLGAALLFGIHLEENFRQPYLAESFEEYWKRWHITMGSWFREYVFYPLAVSPKVLKLSQQMAAGQKRPAIRRAAVVWLPLLATWFCTGIWHGTAWHYALWGLVNGLLILWESCTANKRLAGAPGKIWRIVRTFTVTSFVRILFRAETVADALAVYGRMWLFGAAGNSVLSCGLDEKDFFVAAIGTLVLIGTDMWREKRGSAEKKLPGSVRWAVCLLGVAALMLFGRYGPGYDPAEFFYSRF